MIGKINFKILMTLTIIGMAASFRVLESSPGKKPSNLPTRPELFHDLRKAMDHHEMKRSLELVKEILPRDFDLNEGEVDAILKVFHRTLDGLKLHLEDAVVDFEGTEEERALILTNVMNKIIALIQDYILLVEVHIKPVL